MGHRFVFSLLCAFLTLFSAFTSSHAQTSWEKVSRNLFDRNFEVLTVDPDGKSLFLASDKNLYRTSNGGDLWENIFSLQGSGHLNSIQPEKTKRLFLLSTEGVFKSEDHGRTWKKIFSPLGSATRNSLSLSVDPRDSEILFLGTAQGLYWSLDVGETWVHHKNAFPHEKVRFILHHPTHENILFVATGESFYRSEDFGKAFTKTLHIPSNPKNQNENPEETETIQEISPSISAVKILPTDSKRLLLGTSQGVSLSQDLGKSWTSLPQNGLGSLCVKDLAVSRRDGAIFLSTEKGVYVLEKGAAQWVEIYEGLVEKSFSSLVLVEGKDRETLFAASKNGVFKWEREWNFIPETPKLDYPYWNTKDIQALKNILAWEPSVLEIQEAAIRYANVKNAKTKRWHFISRLKALIPDLSLRKDLSLRNNIDIDRAGATQPDIFIRGPDSLSQGENISLDWKLSDLIFNSDQASIDSREKLMVELRNDIVSEITRLYFERRRLLMELHLNRPVTNKEHLELLLRIDELTAYLDGMTGGYLSKELEKRHLS